MAQVRISPSIALEVERLGDPAAPAVLLIMGLGMQLTAWPDELVDGLVARGLQVVRFDNRDAGLSTQIDGFVPRAIGTAMLRRTFGLPVHAPYTLRDLAADAVALLDALGLARAHVVGASMGGMVAQIVAGRHGARVSSLTSIMSSSGVRWLAPPRPDALRALLKRPPRGADVDALVAHYVGLFGVIGSPGHPTPQHVLRERLGRSLRRAYRPAGTARQLLAILASGDRRHELAAITVPSLVIHGAADPLVPVSHGRDTARRIGGSELFIVPGMGHDLPPSLMPTLVERIAAHCTLAQARK